MPFYSIQHLSVKMKWYGTIPNLCCVIGISAVLSTQLHEGNNSCTLYMYFTADMFYYLIHPHRHWYCNPTIIKTLLWEYLLHVLSHKPSQHHQVLPYHNKYAIGMHNTFDSFHLNIIRHIRNSAKLSASLWRGLGMKWGRGTESKLKAFCPLSYKYLNNSSPPMYEADSSCSQD